MDKKQSWREALEMGALVFSVIGSFSACALLVFKGGALVHTVETHELRLMKIESYGSPPYSEHFKLDDTRYERTMADIKRIESTLASLSEMKAQLEGIRQQLIDLKERIK